MIQRFDELRGLLEKQTAPRWAPMLALVCEAIPSHDDYWNAAPEGALAGAIREAAWHAGIARPVLDAAFAEIFGASSPNQAAVDWCIARLKERNG